MRRAWEKWRLGVPASYFRAKPLRGRVNPFGYAPNKRLKNRRYVFNRLVWAARNSKDGPRYLHRHDWYDVGDSIHIRRVIRNSSMKPLLKNGRKP